MKERNMNKKELEKRAECERMNIGIKREGRKRR